MHVGPNECHRKMEGPSAQLSPQRINTRVLGVFGSGAWCAVVRGDRTRCTGGRTKARLWRLAVHEALETPRVSVYCMGIRLVALVCFTKIKSSICSCNFEKVRSAIFNLLPTTSEMPNSNLRSAPATSRKPNLVSSICSLQPQGCQIQIFDMLLQLEESQICYLQSAPCNLRDARFKSSIYSCNFRDARPKSLIFNLNFVICFLAILGRLQSSVCLTTISRRQNLNFSFCNLQTAPLPSLGNKI
ncbi:hypothetical protein J1N35_022533 [Gossypium stocksii]|uniref:Uncharacterized protein n=1 Tax=Gossypium stocksii TaxID=47602 RepID=A0A9D3VHT1_9ROSI|nr:hypothetical protein J1N35_022533 [Gossypium stocksii]